METKKFWALASFVFIFEPGDIWSLIFRHFKPVASLAILNNRLKTLGKLLMKIEFKEIYSQLGEQL